MWPDLRRLRSQGNHTDRAVYGYCRLQSLVEVTSVQHASSQLAVGTQVRTASLLDICLIVTWLKNPVHLSWIDDRTASEDCLAINKPTHMICVRANWSVYHVCDLRREPSGQMAATCLVCASFRETGHEWHDHADSCHLRTPGLRS